MHLQVNSSQGRATRSLKERALWKAHEWKIWFFFWLALLKGYVDDGIHKHLGRLTFAMNTLLSESVSREEVEYSHTLLQRFCSENEDYFGLENCTFNVHILLHACQCVQNWGPLWYVS